MAEAKPLQEIMHRVSEGLDRCHPASAKAVLSEFDAFLILDGLLTNLNKQYLDAREQRCNAVREFGTDCMTDMAAILEDSAWCAVQTRYMELRADRMMQKRAQALIEETRAAERKAKEAERDKERLAIYNMAQLAAMIKKNGRDEILMMWLAVFYLREMQRQEALFREQARYCFNRLAA